MSKCAKCNSTGKIGNDFCNCTDGRLQRTLDRSKRTAARKREVEQLKQEAVKKQKQQQLELLQLEEEKEGIIVRPPCKMFDWIEVTQGTCKGIIGVAIDINESSKTLYLEAVRHKKGHGVKGKDWFDWDDIKPLPISKDKDDLLFLIDLALDRDDEDWFIELTNQLLQKEAKHEVC